VEELVSSYDPEGYIGGNVAISRASLPDNPKMKKKKHIGPP